jgi:hypothetical protein
MKLRTTILLCALNVVVAHGAQAAPLCPVRDNRTVEDTLDAIANSPHREVILAETGVSMQQLHEAQREQRLTIRPCGVACDGTLRTSRIKNGVLVYVRLVQPDEPVLWLAERNGSSAMLVLPYCCQTLQYDSPPPQHNAVRFGPEQYTPCVGAYGYGVPCINSSSMVPFNVTQ